MAPSHEASDREGDGGRAVTSLTDSFNSSAHLHIPVPSPSINHLKVVIGGIMAGTSRRAPLVLSPTDAHRHQRAGVCASLRVERSISHLPVNNQVNQSDRNSNLPRSVIAAAAAAGPGPDGPQQIKDCGGVMVAADGLLGGKVQKFLQAQRKVVIGAPFFFIWSTKSRE